MLERGIRGWVCHSIYQNAEANNKDMKELYLQYWDVNNLYGWKMLQKLPVNNFEWIEDTSQFNEDFIKNYNEESDKEYFLEVDVQCSKKLHNLHNAIFLIFIHSQLSSWIHTIFTKIQWTVI